MLDSHEFALCLTHDVDRPYETFQAPYYAIRDRDPARLRTFISDERPFWQFETVMETEAELGVRSSFYFLQEKRLFRDKPVREWFSPTNWKLFTGRYDVTDDEIATIIGELDRGGWEVGLHGSYESYEDGDRLRHEKTVLESVLGDEVIGGRQHYLNLDVPRTWELQRAAGLRYDASLGSVDEVGFQHGYDPLRPFDDEFIVFPLTAMEVALMADRDDGRTPLERVRTLLWEAAQEEGVVTVLWHPQFFNEELFPGYRRLYVDLIEFATDLGAWIGPVGNLYRKLTAAEGVVD